MPESTPASDPLAAPDRFVERLLGRSEAELRGMLDVIGVDSVDTLVEQTIPPAIRMSGRLELPPARTEREVLEDLRELADQNQVFRSYLGLGYHGTVTPPVLRRMIFENPGWYTQYTPYQAEISQGRLEALLNFQTMVSDLTALPVANSSLLDEATAAAEAMTLCHRMLDRKSSAGRFFVADHCHPQTIEVVRSRAEPLGFEIVLGRPGEFQFDSSVFGALLQYPTSSGSIDNLESFCAAAHEVGARVVVATDLLALTLLRPPGEFGADIAVGNSQRFGVPLFAGGPHAAFMSAREECLRKLPGRIVGVSVDARGERALRLALQTREQHIRRDRATSNICTAQVLLAVAASMYAVYHGAEGLTRIARRLALQTRMLADRLREAGASVVHDHFFDTLRVRPGPVGGDEVMSRALARQINLRRYDDGDLGIALDETVDQDDLDDLAELFGAPREATARTPDLGLPRGLERTSSFLSHEVFRRYRTEHEFLRYTKRLESRDLSLTTSMISLGSCTMKLNPAAEMIPILFEGFCAIHPFAPPEQTPGYTTLIERLSDWLCRITGFSACSMQPNAGSQGEYAGLLTIRAYHRSRGQEQRNVCLIPVSAHGTNPASAVLAGMKVVGVRCDEQGNIDVDDLAAKAEQHGERLAALMVTYPSTHGVFEEAIQRICEIVHQQGGQVYVDGANMNAMVGLCRPSDLGGDVCHLNLHKTFGIPHGGGGPGMGPICVADHLAPHLPSHPLIPCGGEHGIGAISSAPHGSAGVLPISYAFIAMLGADGLERATRSAILNANYIAERLTEHFPVLYRGQGGRVAHECIVDLRDLKARSGVDIDDVAKRLIDYGFHAPTMSFPVAGTLMIEPTESESLRELDRFCATMIAIREEIREIEAGEYPKDRNVLKGAPHTAVEVTCDDWDRPYPRHKAAFPLDWSREHKFWPHVGRVDNVQGDRQPCCQWPIEAGCDDTA